MKSLRILLLSRSSVPLSGSLPLSNRIGVDIKIIRSSCKLWSPCSLTWCNLTVNHDAIIIRAWDLRWVLVSTPTVSLIHSAANTYFRVVIGDSFLIVIVEESSSSIMRHETPSRHHVRLDQSQVAFHIWWSDWSIFRVQGHRDASSIWPWCNMDFASILDCFDIWVILAKILKSLAEIAPDLRAIDRTTCLLGWFADLGRWIRVHHLLVCRLLVITRELIFFLKEVVWTNGSLSLLWRRSAIILGILYVCPPLMMWRALLVWDFDLVLFLCSYLGPCPLVIC